LSHQIKNGSKDGFCKTISDPCALPNPCAKAAEREQDADKKANISCVPGPFGRDENDKIVGGFTCVLPVLGDQCKGETVTCTHRDFGQLSGCPCVNGKCSSSVGCNRVTNRCIRCYGHELHCPCTRGSCSPPLVCDDGICVAPPIDVPWPQNVNCNEKGTLGCRCGVNGEKCQAAFFCNPETSMCELCREGCGDTCAFTAVGRNDSCAFKSASCEVCKADSACNWCGSVQGCKPGSCDDGSPGVAVCPTCADGDLCFDHSICYKGKCGYRRCRPEDPQFGCARLRYNCPTGGDHYSALLRAAELGSSNATACAGAIEYRKCLSLLCSICAGGNDACESSFTAFSVDKIKPACPNLCDDAASSTTGTAPLLLSYSLTPLSLVLALLI
jgi:hypothetical protein